MGRNKSVTERDYNTLGYSDKVRYQLVGKVNKCRLYTVFITWPQYFKEIGITPQQYLEEKLKEK